MRPERRISCTVSRMPLSTTRLLRKLSCKRLATLYFGLMVDRLWQISSATTTATMTILLSMTLANTCIQKGHPSRHIFRMMNMTVACFATEIGAKWMPFKNDESAVSFQHSLYKNSSVVCKHSARVRNRLQNRMRHLSKGIIPLVWNLCFFTVSRSHWLTSSWRQPLADVIKNLFLWRQPMADVIKNLFLWRHKTFCFFMTS